jgi:Flp pilus assembly pilin Flp
MVGLYVWGQVAMCRLGRKLKQQDGLAAIEYGVFAAFLVLSLVAVATFAGPALKLWMMQTMCGVMGKSFTAGAASCS